MSDNSKKKWRFELYFFDTKSREIRYCERAVTKAMTEKEFKKVLKQRLEKVSQYKESVCYKIGSW